MRRLMLLTATLALLFAGSASAQMVGQLCSTTFAGRANCGLQAGVNMNVRITDSNTVAHGATIAGGGANEVLGYCEALVCFVAADDAPIAGGSGITGTTAATFTINSDSGGAETATLDAGGADPIVFGSADITQQTWDTDGADLGLDDTANTLTLTATTTASAVFAGADAAAPANTVLDTATTGTITIGSADVTNVLIDSDAGLTFVENDESIINNADGTFDFTREEAGVVTITASDDADPVTGMVIDPTGAGSLALGSADVTTLTLTNNGAMTIGAAATTDSLTLNSAGAITLEATGAINIGDATATSVPIITDGGTVIIDGTIVGRKQVFSLASGALTLNSVHLATAGAADYDIPTSSCDAAGDIGNWVTVVIEDASVVVSITSDDTSDIFTIPGLGMGADDEVDSVSDAAHEGVNITFTCLATNNWYMTAGTLTNATFDALAWADGGGAD